MLNQLVLKVENIKKILSNAAEKDIKETQILFFSHDADRGVELEGKAYSQLLDTVREEFEEKDLQCLTIAHPYSSFTANRGFGNPVSINRKYFFARIKNRLFNFLSINQSDKLIDLYDWIFEKTKCRLIITIGSPPELCESARKRNIFHLELLHGVGYTFVPWGWDKLEKSKLPQGILALDEISLSTFSSLKVHGIEVKTIPHPFLKRFTQQNLNKIPNEWKMPKDFGLKYPKRILVSFTWGYAGDHGNIIQIANLLKNGLFYDELAEVVSKTKEDVFWHFRFHPVQLRGNSYRHLISFMDSFVSENPNTDWKIASKIPLPSVLTHCDGHITMSSMSCYDAASMGVNSLVLCPNMREGGLWSDYFTDLVEEGYVRKEPVSVDMLLDWVKNVSKNKPRLGNLLDKDSWDNALSWMLQKSGLE